MQHPIYVIEQPPFYFLPTLHYTMECAALTRLAIEKIKPDCIAVELPEPLQDLFLEATSRLPDISVIETRHKNEHLYYPIEPCDASLEALRTSQEKGIQAFCIDLELFSYPQHADALPDPYAIHRIGLQKYYEAYEGCIRPEKYIRDELDRFRELYMAKRLKELSFSYDRILVVVGMSHVRSIQFHLNDQKFEPLQHVIKESRTLFTLSDESIRDGLKEYGWITRHYEDFRHNLEQGPPDRQKLIIELLKKAQVPYEEASRLKFPPWAEDVMLKFLFNWSRIQDKLLPNLFQILSTAKSCVDHNYAYEVWKLATEYPFHKNIDNMEERILSPEQLWGGEKKINFHLKNPSEKSQFSRRLKKDKAQPRLFAPDPFSLCSYPPEDSVIENFGLFLKQRAKNILLDENAQPIPFTTSIEEGIDTKETIRHWAEKKLYVRKKGKPPGQVGACVVIFDEDPVSAKEPHEKYPWKLTWIGENEQESDMALYATDYSNDIIGPGIARCELGGFMLSYPPRRLWEVWQDPDYYYFSEKPSLLLAAAIDYSIKPVVVYVAKTPPPANLKTYAARQGKRVCFIPITQFSARQIKKMQTFHVLQGRHTTDIAGDYIV